MVTLLHFADAHIDIATQGRRDPVTGLPVRVLDFLSSLDHIIDAAIEKKVELVLFAGDTYKDRNPAPTYQREWGKRIMRLSQAKIPTLLLVGNHDMSPAAGRAATLQEFDTLQIPYVKVIQQPCLFKSKDLWDLPLQVVALPWLYRTSVPVSDIEGEGKSEESIPAVEGWITRQVDDWIKQSDSTLPIIIFAHASVNGALFGNERSVMLGKDMILPEQMLKQPGVDYVALGHIHKSQNLNEGRHPPIIYPGSIERVDFNEANDKKYYVLAQVEKGKTNVEFCTLNGRAFIDRAVRFSLKDDTDHFMTKILETLPDPENLTDSIFRLVIEYPRDWDALLNEQEIRKKAEKAFEFHLIKKPQTESRVRLPGNKLINELTTYDLLTYYLQIKNTKQEEIDTLRSLAEHILEKSHERIE